MDTPLVIAPLMIAPLVIAPLMIVNTLIIILVTNYAVYGNRNFAGCKVSIDISTHNRRRATYVSWRGYMGR